MLYNLTHMLGHAETYPPHVLEPCYNVRTLAVKRAIEIHTLKWLFFINSYRLIERSSKTMHKWERK